MQLLGVRLALAAIVVIILVSGAVLASSMPTLDLAPFSGSIGEVVRLEGEGFEAGATVKLVWTTFAGEWNLSTTAEGFYTGLFLGPTFEDDQLELGTATVDEDGKINTTITVPEDFGGTHNLLIVDGDNVLTQAGFRVIPSVEYAPKAGPVGTQVTVTVKGLNHPHFIEGWYMLLYDNKLSGYISGMNSKGTAEATITASGGVGTHVIEVHNGPFGHPYRALETSPYNYLPVFKLPFQITTAEPVLPPPPEQQVPPAQAGREPEGDGPAIWFNPSASMVGVPTVLYGKGFPTNTEVAIYKYGQRGNRVTAAGYWPIREPFLVVKTDANGRIGHELTMPDTHGGIHRIGASVGDNEVALSTIEVYRTPVLWQPKGRPVESHTFTAVQGEELELKLKGIGWTETENIFAIVYDGAYIGYSCGFSSIGDVLTNLMATGEPGWHFIDLYPSFYRNEDYAAAVEAPFLYRQALLSWQDHPSPMRLRYAFEIQRKQLGNSPKQ